jgi:ankyrin repeat protein
MEGADINAPDSNGDRPLMLAALYASIDCMKFLLEQHAKPNEKNNLAETALMWCAQDADKVKLLVSYGADLNIKSNKGNTAFLIACKGIGQTENAKWMKEHGVDCLVVNSQGETALTRAAEYGDTNLVIFLLENNADINAKDKRGNSALIIAIANENWENTKLLLDKTPDNAASDSILGAALTYAVVLDSPEIVREMLKKVKNIDWTDPDGYTALMWAVYNEHIYTEIIKAILERKPKIDHQANDGSSAISWALKKGNTPIIQMLQLAQKK